MKGSLIYCISLVLCAGTPPIARASDAISSFRKNMTTLEALRRESEADPFSTHLGYAKAYEAFFGPRLEASKVGRLTAAERAQLLELILIASYQATHSRYLADLLLVIEARLQRAEATRDELSLVYDELTSKRRFDMANDFTSRVHLDRPRIVVRDAVGSNPTSATALFMTDKPHQLERRVLALDSGPCIIVLSTPECGFCAKAARMLSSDARLRDVFRHYSYWVAPMNMRYDYEAHTQWQERYPDLRVAAMYDAAEWPAPMAVANPAVPVFYFFMEGELKDTLVGWPEEGAKERLVAALTRIGLHAK